MDFHLRSFFIFLVVAPALFAQVRTANPTNYTTFLGQLQPGDTLVLESGHYADGLNIYNMEGEAGKPIVICADQSGDPVVFAGRSCCNTVSIKQSAYITLCGIVIDGQNIPGIDAVKAEGSQGNWAHDITLEDLTIVNHGTDQQQVGISTKCPVWNWTIRGCFIYRAGTGMYLGNSNGEAPFVNGVIEYNLVTNTIGYNLQVKHQNEGLRTVPGMVTSGKTIIRYNIFSKEENASLGSMSRPNLLVGNFPASGDGENDRYEIYGNFFYQNPSEALFQGTGNFALYSNVFLNTRDATVAIAVLEHNGFKPRTVDVFCNTVLQNSGPAIRMWSPDTAYDQRVIGNAIFTLPALDGPFEEAENIKVNYNQAGDYLVNVYSPLLQLDFRPLPGKLGGNIISERMFDRYEDYNLDFDGYMRDWSIRGAYGRRDAIARWQLTTDEPRTPVDSIVINGTEELPAAQHTGVTVWPNPLPAHATLHIRVKGYAPASVAIFDLLGREMQRWDMIAPSADVRTIRITPGAMPSGMYLLVVREGNTISTQPLVIR